MLMKPKVLHHARLFLTVLLAFTSIFAVALSVVAQPKKPGVSTDAANSAQLGAIARRFYEENVSRSPTRGREADPMAISSRFFTGAAAHYEFGNSVASAGDVNGDGYSDVIVGAPGNEVTGPAVGKAYIYFGGPNMDNTPDVTLTAGEPNINFGYSVAGAGDVNGDGYADVIVGAFGSDVSVSYAGAAYIYFGGAHMDNIADVILIGVAANDRFGYSVSGAGDVNGDGYGDVIVGAYQNDAAGIDAGRAYVYFGGPGMDNIPDVTLTGAVTNDQFGISVASAGDVNGDGYGDVIVGAYENDAGGSNAGRAYIYFGGPSMDNTADVTLTGEAASDYFGISVAGAGDVNGDGYSDVIVGAPYNDAGGTNAGRAYIYFGGISMDNAADVVLTGTAGEAFGLCVASAGDVNGDGYSDVIVSAHSNDAGGGNAGRAYIFFGGTSMDNVADVIFTGEAAYDEFGFSVAGAGDVNGDGYSDVIVGAPLNGVGGDQAGRAYLYLNSLTGTDIPDEFFTGAAAGDNFGFSVASAGDVNGDGYSDVIVGAYQNYVGGSSAGRAYIYFGGPGMDNIADVILAAEAAHDEFGYSVASAGDVNGDGYSDVIVGAPFNSAGGAAAGRAYIYFGGPGIHNAPNVTLTGAAAGDYFGWSVASAGDVNGDGYSDVIVGAYLNDAGGLNAGRGYIYFGGPSMDDVADVTLTGEVAGDHFGASVSSAGDVNGDGYSDVIIGALLNAAGGTDAGRAYVYFGGASMDNVVDVTLTGEVAGDHFGASVASAGDVNGDGYSDVIVGAYSNDAGGTDAGRGYIYFGGASMDNIADVTFTGAADGDLFGYSVAGAGDVNRDGYGDVIVGAPLNNAGGYAAGRAYIYFGGASMDNIADVTLTGAAAYDEFGFSVASAGDVNGDGYSDVIVGAPFNSAGGAAAGRAYLYLSSSPPIIPRIASVKDVPYDQGGKVAVRWIRSGYDAHGIAKISDYVVQRSLPPGMSGFAWENVTTLPATQDPQYSYTAATQYDSTSNTSGTFYFRVIARTPNPLELWKSNIISGHSVDNLSPLAPGGASATALTSTSVQLHWNADVVDPDVGHYAVYRSTVSGFPISDATRLTTATDTTILDAGLSSSQIYYYRVTTVDIHGNESVPSPELSSAIVVDTKVFLEGCYNGGGTMRTSLNAAHLIPLTQPYNLAPWSYPGTESVSSIPPDVVDWVLVQLRSSPATVVKTRAAFLKSNGMVVDLDGTGVVKFAGSPATTYYIVVMHRNHLSVMTALEPALSGTGSLYDFTTAQTQAYGTNPMVDLGGGKYGIISGDANGDGIVDATDRSDAWNDRLQTGYKHSDVNLDGIVDASDRSAIWNMRLLQTRVP
jgi:hypothetical protein